MGRPSFKRYPLTTGSQPYWPNANYGNSKALNEYAGRPENESIHAVLPHGVFYEHDYVFEGERKAPVPCVLNWPEHRDEVWAKYKEVVPCAAPFLYAHAQYPHAKERRGTLVMPQHSTTLFDMEFDWWKLSDSIDDLPRPITILLYWQDVERGVDKYFRHVTKTCGHVQDPEFSKRLVGFLTGAEYVVSNEVGSYTQYATAAGAKFRLLHEPPRFVLNKQGHDQGYAGIFHNSEDRHPEEKRRIAEIDKLYRDRDFDEPITAEQVECADYYLRRAAFTSPEGLRADLEYCTSRLSWK